MHGVSVSTIRHPNIVQYLGIYRDPDTGLPALLMELMDDSLTHFLESSPQPIPYHIQVNICHDITLVNFALRVVSMRAYMPSPPLFGGVDTSLMYKGAYFVGLILWISDTCGPLGI